jgi:ATP-dependent DNA helicase
VYTYQLPLLLRAARCACLVQVIAFIAFLWAHGLYCPILIVVPLTTVGNWVAEFHRFAPTIPVVRYRGDIAKRAALRDAHIPADAYTKGPADSLKAPMPVFVTAYSDAMRDAEALNRVKWRVMVLDEGHRM